MRTFDTGQKRAPSWVSSLAVVHSGVVIYLFCTCRWLSYPSVIGANSLWISAETELLWQLLWAWAALSLSLSLALSRSNLRATVWTWKQNIHTCTPKCTHTKLAFHSFTHTHTRTAINSQDNKPMILQRASFRVYCREWPRWLRLAL